MTVKLVSTARQKRPAGQRDDEGLRQVELEAEGNTYDEARAALDAQVPDGWLPLYVRTVN